MYCFLIYDRNVRFVTITLTLINAESPTTSACRLNVEDFLLYPLNPIRIPMWFCASGISIFARCLRRLVLMFLRLVSALTFGQKKSAGSHHISSRLSTAPYNLWVEVCAMSAAPIVIRCCSSFSVEVLIRKRI